MEKRKEGEKNRIIKPMQRCQLQRRNKKDEKNGEEDEKKIRGSKEGKKNGKGKEVQQIK